MKFIRIRANKFIVVLLLVFTFFYVNKVEATSPTTYTLAEDSYVYMDAYSAMAGGESSIRYQAGQYYIYRIYMGVYNISKTEGVAGAWYDPKNSSPVETDPVTDPETDNPYEGMTPGPQMLIEGRIKLYTSLPIYSSIKGFSSSDDALYQNNPQATLGAGNYYIIDNNTSMLKISTTKSSSGYWINPSLNKSSTRVAPKTNPSEFISKVGPYAKELAGNNDLYASVMIAQAALESGWGTSSLGSEPYNNLFGIKGTYNGDSVLISTYEYTSSGSSYNTLASFKKYPTVGESLQSYVDILTGANDTWLRSYYYGARVSQTSSYRDATAHLSGTYATSPYYATQLNGLIEQYNLTQYDTNTEPSIEDVDLSTYYITSTVNMRNAYGNIVGEMYRGQEIQAYKNGSYYEFKVNGNIRKVHQNYVSSSQVQGNAYVDTGFGYKLNIRSASTGSTITQFERGEHIKGTQIGNRVYFYYNGTYVYASLDYVLFAEPQQMYVAVESNIRDSNLQLSGRAKIGSLIEVVDMGDYYRYYDNGNKFIWAEYVSKTVVRATVDMSAEKSYAYTKYVVNIRSAETGNPIALYNKGEYISGVRADNKLYFYRGGSLAYVADSVLEYGQAQYRYATRDINIRDQYGNFLGILRKGTRVYTIKLGDYYRYYDNGIKFVWASYLSKTNPLDITPAYTTTTVNVRDYLTGRVVSTKDVGEYIVGQRLNGRLNFDENGRRLYIDDSVLTYNKPEYRIVTSSVNVRNQDFEVVGKLQRGATIYGTRIGSYYRYYDSGVKFIYYTYAKTGYLSSPLIVEETIDETINEEILEIPLDEINQDISEENLGQEPTDSLIESSEESIEEEQNEVVEESIDDQTIDLETEEETIDETQVEIKRETVEETLLDNENSTEESVIEETKSDNVDKSLTPGISIDTLEETQDTIFLDSNE